MNYGFASVQVLINAICKVFSITPHKVIKTSLKSGLLTKSELDKSLGNLLDGLREHTPLISDLLYRYIEYLVSDYLEVVSRVQSTGIPRPHLIRLLNLRLIGLIEKLCEELSPYMGTSIFQAVYHGNVSAINLTMNRLKRIPGWFEFYKTLDKEKKDHLALWKSGKNLPSTVKLIKAWGDSILISDNGWKRIITSLNMAKAIDSLKRSRILISRDKLPSLQADDFYTEIYSNVHSKNNTRLNDLSKLHELFHCEASKEIIKEKSRSVIDDVYELLNTSPNLKHYQYLLKRADAHWHVLNGELKRAGEIYKGLIVEVQYIAGPQLKVILEEALVIGAQLKSPDKVLLKNAYNLQVLFDFQEDYVNDKGIISKHYDDNVEVWLERHWKKQFSSIFPSKILFDGVEYDVLPPIASVLSSEKLDRPDYRNPNRMVKIPRMGRTIPQVNYWIGMDEVEFAKKLIEKGADVLVSSDQNETPLILALQQIDKDIRSHQNDWQELTYLILDKLQELGNNGHINELEEYINLKTQKKHLRAIELAVDSNDPKIVDTVVSLGADLNSDELYTGLPPLYYALEKLANVKDIRAGKLINISQNDLTREIIDRFGIPGVSLDNEHLKESFELVNQLNSEQIKLHVCPEKLRHICATLILNGADVNQKITLSNGLQYNPLALCVEINELELFRLMLEHNGNINFTYIDKTTRNRVNLRDIANYFKATDIMPYLAGINM